MRMILVLWLGAITMFAQQPDPSRAASTASLKNGQRTVVVTTAGWDAVDGTMQRFELADGRWRKVGEAVPVVVGKNGMGWDPAPPGSATQTRPGPRKKEGDGRSPAGIFTIGNVFGFDANGPTKRPYIPLTSTTECVDDVNSEHYAHIVDRNQAGKVDWNSSEKMREIEVYKLGMVVNYNVASTVKGNGSCIFLHIWKGPGRGTAGCTAMDEAHLAELVRWIGDSQASLVQMPAEEFKLANKTLGLPWP